MGDYALFLPHRREGATEPIFVAFSVSCIFGSARITADTRTERLRTVKDNGADNVNTASDSAEVGGPDAYCRSHRTL